MTLELTASVREQKGTKASRALRRDGAVPAVVYGPQEESTAITIPAAEFAKVWKEAGESTVIILKGLGSEKQVLINDVDLDPIQHEPRHVDLYAVEKGKTVEVEVPLSFVGTSPAEKQLGGVLIKVLHSLAIEALPTDLPHEIEVDISSLETFEDQFTVGNLALPKGVTALTHAEEVVALVQEPKEEAENVASDIADVEVEKKGKEEDDTASE